MAEAIIVSIAGEIITNLVTQLLGKVGKFWGIKHELVVLGDTVSTLRAVLDDAEEQSHQSHQIQVWLEKLKEAFYDAQDVLEEVNIEALRQELKGHSEISKEVRTFFSSSNQLAFKLKMSHKVRAVREKIEAINADRKFHLDERSVDSRVERQRRKREETYSFISEGDIKGRDDDKTTVIKFLLDSNEKENVSILPIVGIGGLGKTALAQFIYNDEMVSKHFHLKMWVCVSDDFDVKKIVTNIIACAKKKAHNEDAMERLQSELRREIEGKRYLLVLDDLWNDNPEKWLKLKQLLVGGARGSKILITTRLLSVAKITSTTLPHPLKDLSENASIDLLMQMACRKKEEIQDPEMLAIAKEIVKKCSGVPLVVRTVGHLLSSKETKLEWLRFKDDKLPQVYQSEDSIKSVLELSYNRLPSHLKQCFAFCSLFPKDYEIKKQTLVDLWVAGGFIQPSNGSTHLEDTAHEYFMDLLWSNFFQDFKKDPYTNKESCKMHDLMHDLACLVAGNECGVALDDASSINERTRHISVGDLPISHLKASSLRTYLSYIQRRISEEDLCQLIQSFERLRILDLHDTCVEKVPRSIYKLKHLTYLDLSHNVNLKRLPNSITKLQSLQTLNLSGCGALEELPRGIRKLVSLRNLDIDGCLKLSHVPRGLGQLSSLHRLTRFILPKDKALAKNYCRLGELKELNNIRGSLQIENLGSVTDVEAESKSANLIEKHSLESLALEWGYFNTDDVANRDEALLGGLQPHSSLQKLRINGYNGDSFPRWMMNNLVSSLPNLVEVHIFSCGRCKSLPPLGQLRHLKTLKIKVLPELEYIESDHSSTSTVSFPSLVELDIYICEKLKAVPPAPHLEKLLLHRAHPALINMIVGLNKLKNLEIREIESLECVPEECWKSLASLESLRIDGCHGLTSLSKAPPPPPLGTRHQSNLVDLDSSDSEELDLSNYDNHLILELHNLRSVYLDRLPKLASLPQWLLQLSKVEDLSIRYCSELDLCKDESGNNNNLILDSHGGLHHSLRSVWIESLPKLASPPQWLLQASNLEDLHILYCEELDLCKDKSGNNIILDFHGGHHHSLRSVTLISLPKLASLPQWLLQLSNLERLFIRHCKELDLCKDESGNNNNLMLDSHGGLHHSLRSVTLDRLPKLASLPQWLLQLSNLEHLIIQHCEELDLCTDESGNLIILDSHGGLHHSLRSMTLYGLPKQASLPQWLLQPSNLEHLTITSCEELDICKDESGNLIILDSHGGLHHSLRFVDLYLLTKLASLPQWLLQASNLELLDICCCFNLEELPEQIEVLQSLRTLRISSCPLLTSLPEGMRRLASLTHLIIYNCPKLEKRCKRDGGEDWDKIAHIPHITHDLCPLI